MLASAHDMGQVGWLLAGIALVAVARAEDVAQARQALERVSRRSLLFGHGSVGARILDGLALLAGADGGGPTVIEVGQIAGAIPRGTLARAVLGRSGDPGSTLEAFARTVDALGEPGVDVALIELGTDGFAVSTDGAALAALYLETLGALRLRHPRTTFVPVTAPLGAEQGGPVAWARALLGRAPAGRLENLRREEFNAVLRTAAQGGPLFDIARIESTNPEGRLVTGVHRGRAAPALAPAYADAGGQLNRDGRLRAARHLLEVLSSLPEAGAEAPRPS